MKMIYGPAILAMTFFALVASGGAPDGCDEDIDTGPTPAGQYYVDTTLDEPGYLSIWVYEESNGEAGCNEGDTIVL